MKTIKMPPPNAKQVAAFTATTRYVGYGGARGGGKSWFVRWKAILMAFEWPGIKILITRSTYRELLNNHVTPMLTILNGIAKYNKSDHVFWFPNGSSIWLGYCNCDSDLGQYQGYETDIWFADEAGQMREEWLVAIDACVRGANNFPKRTYFTLNPGGPSHAYFRRLFVDRKFRDGEHPEDYLFVQALVTDNLALMEMQPEYKRALEKLPARLRKAWLEGSWDIFEGMFWDDFIIDPPQATADEEHTTVEELRKEQRWCHVIEPFKIPSHWKMYRSYDFGYGKPFSCAWWAYSPDGVLYRILELYGCTGEPNEGVKWAPDKQFKEIRELEKTHPMLKGREIHGVADPSIWDGSRGDSVADTAMKYQVYFDPGVNDRVPGWMQCHYRLQFDDNGYARMYVFNNCTAFIRTIPTLQYSKTKPEDLDTTQEDHVADDWRYMCMARPIKPIEPEEAKPWVYSPLERDGGKRRRSDGSYHDYFRR